MDERRGTTLKGSVLRHNLVAIQNLWGREKFEEIRAALGDEVRQEIDSVTPLSQVPVAVFAALHEAVYSAVEGERMALSHSIGSEAARLEFGGVYRVLLRTVQYDTIWDRIERTWNHIVGRGAFRWLERGDGYVKADIVGVSGFHPGVWASAAGRAERLLLMSGAKTASVTVVEPLPTRGQFEAYWVG